MPIAFAWGLAEATIFFLVPDIWLTRLALDDCGRGLAACAWAVVGALLGGAALWLAASHGYAPVLLNTFRWLPGINDAMIVETGQTMHRHGAIALLAGAFAGKPYKLYAVHAGAQGVSLAMFLAISAVGRFSRFAAATIVARGIGWWLAAQSERTRAHVHLLFWLIFYLGYFALRG